VTPEAIEQIVRDHFVGGRPVERYRFRDPSAARQPKGGA
jgi:(2Fe-2S) ferredoxin